MVPLTGQNTINDMVDRINEVGQALDDVGIRDGNITGVVITATSGFVGDGSQLTSLDVNNVASGTLAVDRGGTGTTTSTGTGSVVRSASPTFTGAPLSTTASVNTNTTQIATTAFVIGQASAASPTMNGIAAVGASLRYARADHVHPSDTSKVNTSLLGVANGVATLDSGGKVPTSQLPAYVDSVAGKTGVVSLVKGDVGLGDVDNTSDATKSIGGNAATATALQTARAINGVPFNGTADITVADSTKLPLTGGTMTGTIANSGTRYAIEQIGEIGGAYAEWNGGRMHTVQVSCPNNAAAYGGIRWTKWGERHLGAIDCYAGGTNSSAPRIDFHVGNTSNAFAFHQGGHFFATGNVTAYSDIRLKTDIKVIPEALDKVTQLRGVTYKRIDSGERQTGLIAQEVQSVLPEAVRDDGEHLSVAYGNLVGLLIESIKELNGKVDSLQKELDELRRAT